MNLSSVFIMKTTWSSSPIVRSWFSSIIDITQSIHPHLFSWTHKGIWWPHPVAQSAHFSKTDTPLPAPDYNSTAQVLPFWQAQVYQAMLFALHTNYSEGTAPVTSDDLHVVLDSGCTCAISFDWHDFVGLICLVQFVELKGITSRLQVEGIRTVNWMFLNDDGSCVTILLTCLYVLAAPSQLLLPQQLSDQDDTCRTNGTWIGFGKDALIFYQGHCIQFTYHKASNLLIMKLAPGITCYQAFQCSVTDSSTPNAQQIDNLSPASCKLLHLHHQLGHKGFTELQKWATEGKNGILSDVTSCPVPMCCAC